MKVLIVVLNLLFLVQCNASASTDVLVRRPLSGVSGQNIVTALENGKISLETSEDFTIRALVAPYTHSALHLRADSPLGLHGTVLSCSEPPCVDKRIFLFQGENEDLLQYPSLELVWDHTGTTAVDVKVKAVAHGEGADEIAEAVWLASTPQNMNLVPIREVDFSELAFSPKSMGYIIKRELGLRDDGSWRYSQEGKRIILQGRISLPLSEIAAISLDVAEGVVLAELNLGLDTNRNRIRDQHLAMLIAENSMVSRRGFSRYYATFTEYAPQERDLLNRSDIVEVVLILEAELATFGKDRLITKLVFLGGDSSESHFSQEKQYETAPMISKSGIEITQASPDDDRTEVVRSSALIDMLPVLTREVMAPRLKELEIETRLYSTGEVVWQVARRVDYSEIDTADVWRIPEDMLHKWGLPVQPMGFFEQVTSFQPRSFGVADGHAFPTLGPWFFDGPASPTCSGRLQTMLLPETLPATREQLATGIYEFNICYETAYRDASLDALAFWDPVGYLSPEGGNQDLRRKEKVLLVPASSPTRSWDFELNRSRYVRPLRVVLPKSLPSGCQIEVRVNDEVFAAAGNGQPSMLGKSLPLPLRAALGPLTARFTCPDLEQPVEATLPRFLVRGLRKNPESVFAGLALDLGGEQLDLAQNPPPLAGGWIDLGVTKLSAGDVTITAIHNELFEVKRVELSSNIPGTAPALPAVQVQSGVAVILRKILRAGLVASVLVVVGVLVVVTRARLLRKRHGRQASSKLGAVPPLAGARRAAVLTVWGGALMLFGSGLTAINYVWPELSKLPALLGGPLFCWGYWLLLGVPSLMAPGTLAWRFRHLKNSGGGAFFLGAALPFTLAACFAALRINLVAEFLTVLSYWLCLAGLVMLWKEQLRATRVAGGGSSV